MLMSSGLGKELAWITGEPPVMPEIGTSTVVVFAGKVTVAGTPATDGFSELKFTVKPPLGTGPDKYSGTF